jgi:hypothetical protein
MLLEIPYKQGDIVSFKMTSGEEVVGRFEEETDSYYELRKPMVLIAGQQGLGLAPFMFSVSPDSKFRFKSQAISCVVKTESEIAKQYTTQTTGIQTL